jgi:hypothetical protein
MSKRKIIFYALFCDPANERVPQDADASFVFQNGARRGTEWLDLPRQGTGGGQGPRAPRHDPAGLALSDVPQAMRAGAAIPKADDLRPRNDPQDHIIALTRELLVAPWQLAPTGRFQRCRPASGRVSPTWSPTSHWQRSDEPRRTPSPASRYLRKDPTHLWHQPRRVTRCRHAGRRQPPLWSICRGNTASG